MIAYYPIHTAPPAVYVITRPSVTTATTVTALPSQAEPAYLYLTAPSYHADEEIEDATTRRKRLAREHMRGYLAALFPGRRPRAAAETPASTLARSAA